MFVEHNYREQDQFRVCVRVLLMQCIASHPQGVRSTDGEPL